MSEERSVTVVSAVPGRLRVRADRSLRSPDSMHALEELLCGLKGVREVQVNPTTGSFLVFYDPKSLNIAELYLAAQAANLNIVVPGMGPEAGPEGGVSEVAQAITTRFGQVDRAVAGFTGGKLDAKTLAPLALSAVAVRQLVTQGARLSAIPWYVLLWYSFEMFTKYNLKGRSKPRPRPSERAHRSPR